TYEYHRNGRAFRVTEASNPGQTTSHSFAYDLVNDSAEFVDERGYVTEYQHDGAGRLTRQTYPNRSQDNLSWDSESRLTEFIDAASLEESYSYRGSSPGAGM